MKNALARRFAKKNQQPRKPELKSLGNCWFRGTVNNAQKCNLIIFTTRVRNRLLQLSRDAGAERCVHPCAEARSIPKAARKRLFCRVQLEF